MACNSVIQENVNGRFVELFAGFDGENWCLTDLQGKKFVGDFPTRDKAIAAGREKISAMRTEETVVTKKHVFEHLGKPPYKFIGYEQKHYQACAGAPIQVGGSCDHCGQGIVDTYTFQSADGRIFHVGSTCVGKAGDAGMRKQIDPIVRKVKREKRIASNQRRVERAKALLPEVEATLAAAEHPWYKDKTRLDYVNWLLKNGGVQGGAIRACRMIEAAAKKDA